MANGSDVPPRLDIAAVRGTLRSGSASPAWMSGWLSASYADPESFRSALRAHATLRRGGLKGDAHRRVDFYHDCVVAHLGQGKRALVVHEQGRDVELTYDALHARCGGLSTAWMERGAEPGQCVCLSLPLGVDYAVALMTALRLGLVVCTLPPGRQTSLRNRVRALAPDAVVIDESEGGALRSLELDVWPTRDNREPSSAGSQSYAADDTVLRLFSPFGPSGLTPLDLAAGPLFAGLLSDALLVFALQDGDTLAMPGFEVSTCQPTALLTSLLAGAAWAELSPRALVQAPELLQQTGVTVVGLTRSSRDDLLALGAWPRGGVRAWFRSLTEPLDIERWDQLASLAAAAGVPGFNLVQASAAGGVLLFGAPLKDGPGLHVWPPPGQVFQLSEVAAQELPALSNAGVYHPLLGEKIVEGAPTMFLTQTTGGYLCMGSLDVGPGSMTYPIDEVSALVEQHPDVEYASVVVSAAGVINAAHVTLLVFVEWQEWDMASSSRVSPSELSTSIAREFGEAFVPLRIEIIPLRPRTNDEGLDRGWCRSQYLSGALRVKARREIFLLLSRLSYLLDVTGEASS